MLVVAIASVAEPSTHPQNPANKQKGKDSWVQNDLKSYMLLYFYALIYCHRKIETKKFQYALLED